jgi:Uma2 family endonuclease
MRSTAPLPTSADDDVEPPEDWYLDDGFNMPVTKKNDRRGEVLRRTFEAAARRQGRSASMLVNVALRWDSMRRGVGVDPDVMWVEPAVPEGLRSVLTWHAGVNPPRVAVEIVSVENAEKDYRRGPAKYGASGTKELWVFDPDGCGRDERGEGPWRLQVWRRDGRGRFRRMYAGDGPEFSRELGAWLVVVRDTLRVSDDEAGTRLWPTTDEERDAAEALARAEARARQDAESKAKDAESKAKDAESKAKDAESKAKDAESKAKDAEARAEAEAAARRALEAKLAALEAKLAAPPKRGRRTGRASQG